MEPIEGGATPEADFDRIPEYNVAKFIAQNLSEVMTTDQMKGMIEIGDPRHISPPMSQNQRTVMTERIMRSVFDNDQIQSFSKNGSIPAESIRPAQQRIMKELTAGYHIGQVLNEKQFQTFKKDQVTPMTVNQMEQIRPFVRFASDTREPAYFSDKPSGASPYFMEMGRYMDRPATDFVSNSLRGGAGYNSLVALKQELAVL